MKSPRGALQLPKRHRQRIDGAKELVDVKLMDGVPVLVVQPGAEPLVLKTWARANRESIDAWLLEHGILLFRGFDVSDAPAFEEVVRAIDDEPLPYLERSNPRTEITSHVYTSTDHPADEAIFPHHDLSYALKVPERLFFYCHVPPTEMGRTPFLDMRGAQKKIPAAIAEEFRARDYLYVRNLGPICGLNWKDVYQTESREEVRSYCERAKVELKWIDEERLRTSQRRPVFIRHPRTGEEFWFNHLTFFHVDSLPAEARDAMKREFADDELPNNTYYGDGEPIGDDVMEALRDAYSETHSFAWQRNDIVLLDNIRIAHARTPYRGERKIYVAMSRLHRRGDI